MSSSAYDFLGAEHTITIPEQLNAGARFLMLDAYYGYDDDGLVRTNLAGGVDRGSSRRSGARTRSTSCDRLGALTGTADTSGKKQEHVLLPRPVRARRGAGGRRSSRDIEVNSSTATSPTS